MTKTAAYLLSFTAACLLTLTVARAVDATGNRGSQPGVKTELPTAKPETVGLSAKRLQRIHAMVQRAIDGGQLVGAVTLVARKGRIAHLESHGQMDLEAKTPMKKDALFHIASMTKPVTAVAIMILVEEGKLRLSDPVSRFIPEFKEMKVKVQNENGTGERLVSATREITIRDLLSHTSGLGSTGMGANDVTRLIQSLKPGFSLADVAPRLASIPLDFQPGTQWRYSPGAAFDLLGRVVEIVSEQSYDRFLRERLFEPLGMKETFFVLTDDRRSRLVTKYRKTAGGFERMEVPPERLGKAYFSGAGGLMSTAEDYFRFAQMLLNRGNGNGQSILSPRSLELLSSNFVGEMFSGQLGRPKGMGYGLGVEVVQDAVQAGTYRSNGSFGWDGAYGTYFWVDPSKQLVAILMIQAVPHPGRTMHNDFDVAVLQSVLQSAPAVE